MRKYDYIVAIDPDDKKSGISTLRTADRYITCDCLEFPKLLNHLLFCKEMAAKSNSSLLVVVEAGWLKSSIWHGEHAGTVKRLGIKRAIASAMDTARRVGTNQGVGKKIVEMARSYGLETSEALPLVKCWQGPDRKITQGEIEQFIPGFPKRSNQEVRDSALLAWTWAGFPIRMKVTKPIK